MKTSERWCALFHLKTMELTLWSRFQDRKRTDHDVSDGLHVPPEQTIGNDARAGREEKTRKMLEKAATHRFDCVVSDCDYYVTGRFTARLNDSCSAKSTLGNGKSEKTSHRGVVLLLAQTAIVPNLFQNFNLKY